MGQADTADTAATRLHQLHEFFREPPVTGPEGHSYTAFQARTPASASPALCDMGVVEHIDAAVAEVVHHTRAINPDAGPLPDHVAGVYGWAREHTAHADEMAQQRRDTLEYRHYLEHSIRAGDNTVIRSHRCPDCGTLGLFWPHGERNIKAKASCVNRHCADANGGLSRSYSLDRLAFERVAVEKSLRECAT